MEESDDSIRIIEPKYLKIDLCSDDDSITKNKNGESQIRKKRILKVENDERQCTGYKKIKTGTISKTIVKTEETSRQMSTKAKTNSSNTKGIEFEFGSGIAWESRILSERTNVDQDIATSVIHLFKKDCTVPFIARYRRELTKNMDADRLRLLKDHYEDIKTLKSKAINILKKMEKTGILTPQLKKNICNVRNADELEYIYKPFKKGDKKSKAERARSLGLDKIAIQILENKEHFYSFQKYIDCTRKGFQNEDEIRYHVQNIIADMFAKDEEVLEFSRRIAKETPVTIKSTRNSMNASENVMQKFEIYHNFQTTLRNIQPHQVLALNRGESLKILTVNFHLSDCLRSKLFEFYHQKWIVCSQPTTRWEILKSSFNDSYSRLLAPYLVRQIKSQLNREAQYAAIENFAMNLKSLLCTSPVKGCPVLGIDPGYCHGHKMALVSATGDVLMTRVFHFDSNRKSNQNLKNMNILKQILILNKCELIAIGNGAGVRIIENLLTEYIKMGFFLPDINLKYTILNERGASIYSVSDVAKKEFPDMEPNLISAVFIARSLQDPLKEYVKVPPHNLGVGMYQHDIPKKQLCSVLDEIVLECVSFTGVDVNTASIYLLRHVSGLGDIKAVNIIEYREKNGPFTSRHQLKNVKGIGPKTFEQCSGFLRIFPETARALKSESENSAQKFNPLDRTHIHPESYAAAEKFTVLCGLKISNLGTPAFTAKVVQTVNEEDISKIATFLEESENVICLIAEALSQLYNYDYRSQFSKPVFRREIHDIDSLSVGITLTGVVNNVTNFGAFVDAGIGRNGLIHTSQMKNSSLQVGDRVEVKVISAEIERQRVSYTLLRKLT